MTSRRGGMRETSEPKGLKEGAQDDGLFVTRATLLQRVRDQNDEGSWQEFIRYYERFVHNVARRMGLKHHDAEEVVQSVNLILWRKLPEFRYDADKGRFRGWLCTVVGNEVKKLLRRERQAVPEARAEEVDARAHAPEVAEIAEQEWRRYIAGLAWERIRPHFEANALAAFEMLSRGDEPKAVAERLGIAVGSVYVYKKRVQDRLKHEIMDLNSDLD